MVVIDALAYVGESVYWKKRFTAENLIKRMDENNIDKAVVTAPPPGPDYQDANKVVHQAVQEYPERLSGVYKMNPWYKEAELERAEKAVEDWGFKGFKLDPRDESFGLTTPVVKPVMELAGKLKVPVYIHTGDSSWAPPWEVAFLAASFPNVPVIVRYTELGVRLAAYPPLVENLKNVIFASYPLRGGSNGWDRFLKEISKSIDTKRVVFTTEVPFGYPELELKIIELNGMEREIKELIMGENIKRILRL